ncbi:FAST kinase domain-containing protein 5, mitochondrial [Centruroides vittatus]|uniref:FAST kinase domain-containing protein 5, mitochondrial n=1 Tax=Centruroides vittatus TaxID=120091 RepID=UPI00350FD5BC
MLRNKCAFLQKSQSLKYWCLFKNIYKRCFSVDLPSSLVKQIVKNADRVLYRNKENLYMHSIMENIVNYHESVVKHPSVSKISFKTIIKVEERSQSNQESDNYDVNKAVQRFCILSEENFQNPVNIEDPKYENMIDIISNNLSVLSNNMVISILHCFCMWPLTDSTETRNFKTLWNALDEECANRLTQWSRKTQFLVANYWFHLRLSRITKYNRRLIRLFLRTVDTLNPSEFVQLMFYINLQRWTNEKAQNNVENKINHIMYQISINELAIISMGLFKSRSKINNSSVLKNMINLVKQQIPEINNNYSLASLLKQIRYSSQSEHVKDIYDLQTKCIPFVDKWNPSTCIHVILLGTSINVRHTEILDAVANKLLKDIKEVRLKEITKLLHCLSKYYHKPDTNVDIFHTLIDELRTPVREEEIYQYPTCLLQFLLSLSFFSSYPEDLLAKLFNLDFIDLIKGKSQLDTNEELLTLYYAVQIEMMNNKIKFNPDEILKDFEYSSMHSSYTHQNQFLGSICEELNKIFAKDFFSVRKILPYSRYQEIILTQNRNGMFIPLQVLEETSLKLLKPSLNNNWLCIMPLGRNQFSSNDQTLLGLPSMKKRHLMKLGYEVIEIPWFEFLHLSSAARLNYIKKKLFMNKSNLSVRKSFDMSNLIKNILK